ncbi:MAG: hypothetical protein IKS45_12940 [Thermoguttaceae bacterium]|nr:hypothetical protein [Thermoguttaceae bacterium]MBR6437404.1 hypothetical protein [Thermoguttaceae bacterium]
MSNNDYKGELLKLANLVQQMRTAQKNYFFKPNKTALEVAKKLEKEVDAALQDIFYPNPKLF